MIRGVFLGAAVELAQSTSCNAGKGAKQRQRAEESAKSSSFRVAQAVRQNGAVSETVAIEFMRNASHLEGGFLKRAAFHCLTFTPQWEGKLGYYFGSLDFVHQVVMYRARTFCITSNAQFPDSKTSSLAVEIKRATPAWGKKRHGHATTTGRN